MKASEVLEKAASEIETRGLAKGNFEDSKGRVCAVGAIRLVTIGTARAVHLIHPEAFFIACEELQESIRNGPAGYDYGSVTAWNDAASRRKGDVVKRMRKVAAKLKEEGK